MKQRRYRRILLIVVIFAAISAAATVILTLASFPDDTGDVATYNTSGPINEKNAFFQPLGTDEQQKDLIAFLNSL